MTTAPSNFLAVDNVPCRPPTERTAHLAAVAMLNNSKEVIQVNNKDLTEAPTHDDMTSDKVMITTATGTTDSVVGVTKRPLCITFNAYLFLSLMTKATTCDILLGTEILIPLGLGIDYYAETDDDAKGKKAAEQPVDTSPEKNAAGPPASDSDKPPPAPNTNQALASTSNKRGCQRPTILYCSPIATSYPSILEELEHAKHWDRIQAARMSFPVIGNYRAAEAWSPLTFETQVQPRKSSIGSNDGVIEWNIPKAGIVLVEVFGGAANGLKAVLQSHIKVAEYFYVDADEEARAVAKHHIN
eukprot:SM000054S18086  [mRNA]  locus=s54:381984:383191:+ [translate_table: standard]